MGGYFCAEEVFDFDVDHADPDVALGDPEDDALEALVVFLADDSEHLVELDHAGELPDLVDVLAVHVEVLRGADLLGLEELLAEDLVALDEHGPVLDVLVVPVLDVHQLGLLLREEPVLLVHRGLDVLVVLVPPHLALPYL